MYSVLFIMLIFNVIVYKKDIRIVTLVSPSMSDWHVWIFFILDGLEMPLSASFLVTNGVRWLPPRHSFPRVSEPWEDSHPWSTVSWPGGPCGSGWSISAQSRCLQIPVPWHPSHEGGPPGNLETRSMVGPKQETKGVPCSHPSPLESKSRV